MRTREAVQVAMLLEMEQRAPELKDEPLATIYFGGGTPSLLDRVELEALLARAHRLFRVEKDAEVTLEVNPDDVSAERISLWRSLGITRLSIGIQSFREERLRFMGRAHTAEQSRGSLALIAEAGFKSWTMDLIYGLPGMTMDEWDEQLAAALSFGMPHLSAYCLTVEPKTTLDHRVRAGDVHMPADDDQNAQFEHMIDRLDAAGLQQYEISNFARAGHRSRHNSNYWRGAMYLGIGPGSHSFDGNKRRWNVSNNARYAKAVPEGAPYWNEESLTPAQRTNERIMTGLRTIEGVEIAALDPQVLSENAVLIEHYAAQGLLVRMNGRLVLTRKGRSFADRIASDLFITA
jgi:oxygen-independent coproporphyrinogen III oxidase